MPEAASDRFGGSSLIEPLSGRRRRIPLWCLIERTGVGPESIEDVILGHCNGNSEAPAIGRVVALDAGLPVTVPGMHIDRRCGSGLQAVIQAAMQVMMGDNDLVVAGGTESMSNAAFYSTDMRWGGARGGVTVHDALVRARSTAGGRHYRHRRAPARRCVDGIAVEAAPDPR